MNKAQLPATHYDLFRAMNPQAFKFFAEDLKTLRARNGARLEEILPPKGTCAEDGYVQSWAAHVRAHPKLHPELRGGQQAINAVMNHLYREYRFVLGYEYYDRKTYFVTDGLCEALTYTQLNVDCEEFLLPVECFALVFNSDDARAAFSSISGSPARPDTTITVYVRDDNLDEIGFRRLLICAFSASTNGKVDSCVSRQLALKSGWDLERALRTDWDKIDLPPSGSNVMGTVGMKQGPQGEYTVEETAMEKFFEEGKLFFRLVLNTILYISSRDAELVPQVDGVLRSLQRQDLDRRNSDRHFLQVGPSVEGMPIVIGPATTPDSHVGTESGRRVKVRFLVPGFYRRPPNSAANAKKSVWVKPHRRGPEMANLVHRPYIVK